VHKAGDLEEPVSNAEIERGVSGMIFGLVISKLSLTSLISLSAFVERGFSCPCQVLRPKNN
jgi:hypothetical protein